MNVRNCVRCGKIFLPTVGRPYCPDCADTEMALFESVKEYLKKHPGASVIQVSQATGVPVKKIREYVKEGRLFSAGEDWNITCDRCGKAINRGRYCSDCAKKLETGLLSGKARADRPIDKGEMRVHWDRFRRR